ncbi:MAG TPA: DUF1996 domain-containing protein [Albitalea sp.]|uniref:DUF1996 domain-containing protein n=1 Tax=Piscinibacter sp. TaxID=1903157 RepID=UPI002ED6B2AF
MNPLSFRARRLPFRFTLCLLAAAALGACGGGTSGEADADAATAAMASADGGFELQSVADVTALDTSEHSTDVAAAAAEPTPPTAVDGVSASVPVPPGTPVATPPAPQAPGAGSLAVTINSAAIPASTTGYGGDRVKTTGKMPSTTSIGAFRVLCNFSHMANDDPIVYPGQPGRSHLHTFFGNAGTNAYSTAESIATTGNSTCNGGTVNRTGYWVPTLVDTRTNTPLKPKSAIVYYKTGYNGIKPEAVRPFPAHLRMIAGDAKNTTAKGPFTWKCVHKSEELHGAGIQNCPAGGELWQVVFFPQCWDGVNLDSPDHKSHMSYTVNKACPKTHPVPLPEITFNITYVVPETDAPTHWRLSSDAYDRSLPAGYSSHGDWFNGWKKDVMETWVKNCDQASKDCLAYLLGDGREIY